MNNIHTTNIVTIGKDDYRIVGRTVIGFVGCFIATNTVTGKESAIRLNCGEWVIVG